MANYSVGERLASNGSSGTDPSSAICKRATNINPTPICEGYDAFFLNAHQDICYYGNLTTTSGFLNLGDAFDCDVNSDGIYDSDNERFYYLTDSKDRTTAYLIYNKNLGGKFICFDNSIVNIGLFVILDKIGIVYFIANLIALLSAKTVAYLTSKFFVFKKKCNNKKELFIEIFSFIFFRGLTFLIDFFGLIFLIELFSINKIIGKVFLTIIVIILNYIFSKSIIFKKNNIAD